MINKPNEIYLKIRFSQTPPLVPSEIPDWDSQNRIISAVLNNNSNSHDNENNEKSLVAFIACDSCHISEYANV